MSKVAVSGNASGSGTFTIASPNSNSDRTLTLPDSAGTIEIFQQAPLFQASASSQAMGASGVATKMASFGTPEIDNKSWWNAGNNRYIPQIEGWYGVNIIFTAVSTTSSIPLSVAEIYKNGSSVVAFAERSANINSLQSYGSWFVYANGTTDYIELWGRNYTATSPTGTGVMQIYLISRASA
jgi:hypothetical protein